MLVHANKRISRRQFGFNTGLENSAFKVIGSNDSLNWETLFKVRDSDFDNTSNSEWKTLTIPEEKQRSFSCNGVRVKTVVRSGSYLDIKQIVIWEEA